MRHLFISAKPCPRDVLFLAALSGGPLPKISLLHLKAESCRELPCPEAREYERQVVVNHREPQEHMLLV